MNEDALTGRLRELLAQKNAARDIGTTSFLLMELLPELVELAKERDQLRSALADLQAPEPEPRTAEARRLKDFLRRNESTDKQASVSRTTMVALFLLKRATVAEIRSLFDLVGYKPGIRTRDGLARTALWDQRKKGSVRYSDGIYSFSSSKERSTFAAQNQLYLPEPSKDEPDLKQPQEYSDD